MLRAAITFFILGIVCMLLGVNGVAGLSIEIGKILLIVFLVLSVISFFLGRRGTRGSLMSLAFLLAISGSFNTIADDTVVETTKEIGNDGKRAIKKSGRTMKEKTCEMVNGKMDCTVQKMEHAGKNVGDKVEDIVD